jgi:hypothetical protein
VNGNWTDVVAEGRANALRQLGIAPRTLATSGFPDHAEEQVLEFLLGLRTSLALRSATAGNAMRDLARALNFRLGAGIQLFPGADGPTAVNTGALRDRGPGPSRRVRPIATHEHALLAGVRPARRRRLGPRPPVLVLPTAGDPQQVETALAAHLPVLTEYGHSDLTLIVADDASPERSASLDTLLARFGSEYACRIVRFSEWAGSTRPGLKREFREGILARAAARGGRRGRIAMKNSAKTYCLARIGLPINGMRSPVRTVELGSATQMAAGPLLERDGHRIHAQLRLVVITRPTGRPTRRPTKQATTQPTTRPTTQPTTQPTPQPTTP